MEKLERDVRLLAKLSDERLAEIWSILNTWKWPKEIPDPENRENDSRINGRRSVLMSWINSTIGHKVCLKYTNCIRDERMTEKEFDEWWIKEGCFGLDE